MSHLLQVERIPGRPPCLAVSGELDHTTAPLLDAQLREIICARCPDVTIDVSALEFCDSAGLSVFIGASRRPASRRCSACGTRTPWARDRRREEPLRHRQVMRIGDL